MNRWYKLALPVIALFGFHQGVAQTRTCDAHELLQQEIAANPERGERLQQIENFTQQYIANNPGATRDVITIPVVVHVVYNTAAQNVSDVMVQAQITRLNEDFRKLNADAANTPSLFAGLAADCQIEFCLAQRDPAGNATNGITRTYTTRTSFSSNNYVKYDSYGGKSAWDRNSYLNIWVCNLGSGLLGYAQFPGGSAATDGVVVLYSSLPGGTASNYNLGRTATHEVGHWLNLYHIWGDDGTSCSGSDQVGDTPNQGGSNGGCPSFPKSSCSNTSDMWMNYMDYTYDACMYMFSTGQSQRMNALFAPGGARALLLTSQGCVPPNNEPVACGTPVSLSSFGVTTNAASVSWASVSGASSYNLQYKTAASATWSTVNTTSTTYNLTGLASNTTYNFQVQAVCASGAGTYSSASSFTTQQVVTSCTDNYESNNSQSYAKPFPVGSTISGKISPSGDVDWFRFSNTSSQPRIKVTLENLPGDYDLRLYRSSTLLATSENGGTASETIKYNTSTVSTSYYARVYGWNGANSSSQCYALTVLLSNTNWKEITEEVSYVAVEPGYFELYPNPSSGKLALDYLSQGSQDIQIYVADMMGRTLVVQPASVTEGPNTVNLDLNSFANGFYMVMVRDANGESSKQVILQR